VSEAKIAYGEAGGSFSEAKMRACEARQPAGLGTL